MQPEINNQIKDKKIIQKLLNILTSWLK